MVDPVLERIRKLRWAYADYDAAARQEIERRLACTARNGVLITYSDLVSGIDFNLPNVKESPLRLGVPEWIELHRAIIGDFLGRISCDTYERAGFLASAVAVKAVTDEPGEGFIALVRQLGMFSGPRGGTAFVEFWSDQVRRAQDWYAKHDL
jgi:hypothetical protein